MSTAAVTELSNALADLVTTHGDEIVRVEPRGEGKGCRAGGSGIVWSSAADGATIVTAAHLVEDDVTVGLAGRTLEAKVIGRDPGTDVAVLRVDAKDLRAARFRDLEHARVGHLTLSLARPGKSVRAAIGMIGLLSNASDGAVRTRGGGRVDRWLQPDGGVPDGFSGGALYDLSGEALGMNTLGLARGVGVTVPYATLKRVVDELAAHGRIRRGYLGVGVAPVRLGPGKGGVIVVAVEPGGPSDGTLLIGDVILSVEGETITGPRELASVLEERIDVDVKVALQRAGTARDATIRTRARA